MMISFFHTQDGWQPVVYEWTISLQIDLHHSVGSLTTVGRSLPDELKFHGSNLTVEAAPITHVSIRQNGLERFKSKIDAIDPGRHLNLSTITVKLPEL